jgi:hypothetical protein
MRSLASASWVTKFDNESDEVEERKKCWQRFRKSKQGEMNKWRLKRESFVGNQWCYM